MTKIKIKRNGITSSSLSKDYLLRWNEIETIGVYRINRFGVKIVEPENFNKFSLLGQKFIYISREQNFIPKKIQNASLEFIHFHWRQDAWNEILKYIKDKQSMSSNV